MSNQKITALYCRLSKEDYGEEVSNSIENQKYILEKYAEENCFENCEFYVDDRYTGVNFDRPDFQRMYNDAVEGKIGIIVTKDLSRLGRNHLHVGMYTEELFPSLEIRFIAINDGFDTNNLNSAAMDLAPIHNIFNEYHVKQTSLKVRASLKAKAARGERVAAKPPYGYMKDSTNPKAHIIPDPETAPIVKKIFMLCANGYGAVQIANILEKEQVYNPSYYLYSKFGTNGVNTDYPYVWNARTIRDMLENVAYIGHTLNLKTETVSYKIKKKKIRPQEDQFFFENTHEPLIDLETWEIVQQIRQNKRRYAKSGYKSIFSGIVYCSDCGSKLTMRSHDTKKGRVYGFMCSRYRMKKGVPCTIHYISEVALNDLTMDAVRRVTYLANDCEEEFKTIVTRSTEKEIEKTLKDNTKSLNKMKSRLGEIETVVTSLYEDKVFGKISEDEYTLMSGRFMDERKTLESEIPTLEDKIQSAKSEMKNAEQFILLSKKYTEINELTSEILNLFVEKILAHERVKDKGTVTQDIEFIFKHIGKIEF